MKTKNNQVRSKRSTKGQAITELSVALLLLFFFAFFPLVDLLGIGLIYSSCTTLNDLQVKEASLVARSEALNPNGRVQKTIPQDWANAALGKLAKPVSAPQTTVSYDQTDPSSDRYVVVKTVVTTYPFITIPFFAAVPGLGQPVTFVITSQRVLESANLFNN